MRDPLENKTWFLPGSSPIGRNTQASDLQEQQAALLEFNLLANAIRQRARLLALTVDAEGYADTAKEFSRGWARPRMWEHYAENHAGVCLVFDANGFINAVVRSLESQGLPHPYYKRVRYTETGSADLMLDLPALAGQTTPSTVAQYIEDHHVDLFFRKALDWETEHEYRFVLTAPEGYESDVFVDFGESLMAAIVGEKFPSWQLAAAIDVCVGAGVDPLRLDWTTGRPTLAELPPGQPTREETERFIGMLRGVGGKPPTANS
jgi:hypothetical protein